MALLTRAVWLNKKGSVAEKMLTIGVYSGVMGVGRARNYAKFEPFFEQTSWEIEKSLNHDKGHHIGPQASEARAGPRGTWVSEKLKNLGKERDRWIGRVSREIVSWHFMTFYIQRSSCSRLHVCFRWILGRPKKRKWMKREGQMRKARVARALVEEPRKISEWHANFQFIREAGKEEKEEKEDGREGSDVHMCVCMYILHGLSSKPTLDYDIITFYERAKGATETSNAVLDGRFWNCEPKNTTRFVPAEGCTNDWKRTSVMGTQSWKKPADWCNYGLRNWRERTLIWLWRIEGSAKELVRLVGPNPIETTCFEDFRRLEWAFSMAKNHLRSGVGKAKMAENEWRTQLEETRILNIMLHAKWRGWETKTTSSNGPGHYLVTSSIPRFPLKIPSGSCLGTDREKGFRSSFQFLRQRNAFFADERIRNYWLWWELRRKDLELELDFIRFFFEDFNSIRLDGK